MVQQWYGGNSYGVGDVVTYRGYYYKVTQAHTSKNDWNPEATPALFGKQGPVESYGGGGVPPPQAEEAKPREAKLSHQLIAGAAAFEAARAYEHHKEKTTGEPSKHAHAKELAAGLLGAFADRLVETKGLDALDKHKAKKAGKSEKAERD